MVLQFQLSIRRFASAWTPSTRLQGKLIAPSAAGLTRSVRWMTSQEHQESQSIDDLLENWRAHPAVNPKLAFPTLIVPIESLTLLVPKLQPYLAKNAEIMKHIHPRIKMVKGFNETHKMMLLNSDIQSSSKSIFDDIIDTLELDHGQVTKGPDLILDISYSQLSYQYILSQLLGPLGVSVPSAYEQIGHIAHFNFKPVHEPYGKLIAEVLRETNPTIETVVSKVGQVHGKFRTYDLNVLAGPDNLETTVVEHGVHIQLHIGDCYWCTRLGGERQLLIQDILNPSVCPVGPNEKPTQKDELVVADVFSGVGAVCLLLAKQAPSVGKNVTILANDWNPRAIEYFQKSIQTNSGLTPSRFHLSNGDAYDFLIDVGAGDVEKKRDGNTKFKSKVNLPDHVLMNFPLHGPTFLGALRWWPWKSVQKYFQKYNTYPRFHVYTFSRGEKGLDESIDDTDHEEMDTMEKHDADEAEVAVDIIANELLPGMGEDGSAAASSRHRRKDLDDAFGTQFSTRIVRDVAPGKVVVCVSFFLTPKLIRHMQGDYV